MKKGTGLIMLIGLCTLLFSSCMSTMNLQVLQPAEIDIPTDIKKLAVINRSIAGEGEKVRNVVEGLFSGEGIGVDRNASDNTVNALTAELASSPRFSVVAPREYDLRGTGTSRWPIPLDWDLVSEICERHNTDALVTIETFDSDQVINMSTVKRTRKENDKTIEYIEHQARMDVRVDVGWRIYYPSKRRIIDENIYTDHQYFDAAGNSPKSARNNLISNRRAVIDAGYFAGARYAYRISPLWINVSRSYYSKGNDDLKFSKRFVKTRQWEEARKIWEKYIDDADPKIAGRSMYNIALSHEVNGDLESALKWANDSYVMSPKGTVKTYISTLKRRLYDQQRLDQQMENR